MTAGFADLADHCAKLKRSICDLPVKSPTQISEEPKNKQREHWTQKTSDNITKAKDAAGCLKKMPRDQQPNFHEIRALSAHLLEQFGEEKKVIQEVLGHTRDSTTEIYLESHEHRYKNAEAPIKGIKI